MRKQYRLPPISALLILEAIGLEVFRDRAGMHQCLTHGIGPRRIKLGAAQISPLRFVPPLAAEEHDMTAAEAVEIARDEARTLLKAMCAKCPFRNCRMKSWS